MKCPFCSYPDTQVKDSRATEDNTVIRRRRVCSECTARFTTFERIQLRDLMVIKNNGKREAFVREKLVRSFSVALRKRHISEERIDIEVDKIIRHLEKMGDHDIPAHVIGECVMEALKSLDHIAYLRYASVYRNFREIKDFSDFIDQEVSSS